MRPWMLLVLLSCKGGDVGDSGTSPGVGLPDVDDAECEVDDDCKRLVEICEDAECVAGDRDDTFDGATPIFQNQDGEGTIYPAEDVDHFVYSSTGPEWLEITTWAEAEDPTDNLDIVVQVYESNGALYAVMDNSPIGRWTRDGRSMDTLLHIYLPRADDWYITVEDVTTFYDMQTPPRGGRDFDYTIGIAPFDNVTEEPDAEDDPGYTFQVDSDRSFWYTGVLLETGGDVDWISVEHDFADRPLEVYGQEQIPGSSMTPLVTLLDEEGETVFRKPELGADGYASWFDAQPGTYVLSASDLDLGGGEDAWMMLYIRTYETDANHPFFGTSHYQDEVEPNNMSSQATSVEPVDLGDAGNTYKAWLVQGALEALGDLDRFSVTTESDEFISVRCFSSAFGSTAELSVDVYDGGLNITPEGEGDEPTDNDYYVLEADASAGGVYQVQISSAVHGRGAYYRCRILVAEEGAFG